MPTLTSDFWENEKRRLMALFLPRLTQMALTGMTTAARQAGISFDNLMYSKRAEAWARTYTDQLLADFGTTTEKIVGGAVADWISKPNMTVGDLDAALTPAFGATRANAIAVTETTRAFANGQLEAYKAEGIDEIIWSTNKDDLVCPICGPLSNKRVKIGQAFGKDKKGNDIFQPPGHVRCRCWIRPGVSRKPKDEPKEIPNEVIAQIQDANTQANKPIKQLSDAEINARAQADFAKFLSDFEGEITKQNYETAGVFKDGKKILIKDGKKSSVGFTKAEIRQMEGGMLTHNHPGDPKLFVKTFSGADIKMLVTHSKLKEIRAVSEEYVYIMSNDNSAKMTQAAVTRSYNKSRVYAVQLIKQNPVKYQDRHEYDVAWELFAEKHGLTYTRIKR